MEPTNLVTEADVLQGFKRITTAGRDGAPVTVTVNALSWRAAIGSTFKRVEDEMVHTLENAVGKTEQPLLDKLPPNGLVEIRNVALQLTHGIDALKKSLRTDAPATTDPQAVSAPLTPITTPPSAT